MQTITRFWKTTTTPQRFALSIVLTVVLTLLVGTLFSWIAQLLVGVIIAGCLLGFAIVGTIDAVDNYKYKR